MRIPVSLALLLFAALLASSRTGTAQVIQGSLLDAETGEPVPRAAVTLLAKAGLPLTPMLTNGDGAFAVAAPRPGSYQLRVERSDYNVAVSPMLVLGARDTLWVEFRVSTKTIVLDPVVVTGRRRGSGPLADFHKRSRDGSFGAFITRADIARRKPVRTTDLLRSMSGVRLVPRTIGGGYSVMLRGTCAPAIFIDGVGVRALGHTVDDLIAPWDLEGIEIYRSASEAPPQYTGTLRTCGVILFWTQRGD